MLLHNALLKQLRIFTLRFQLHLLLRIHVRLDLSSICRGCKLRCAHILKKYGIIRYFKKSVTYPVEEIVLVIAQLLIETVAKSVVAGFVLLHPAGFHSRIHKAFVVIEFIEVVGIRVVFFVLLLVLTVLVAISLPGSLSSLREWIFLYIETYKIKAVS